MTPEVSAIVVNYRSADEARQCVASLRGALSEEGIPGEIVLVDCGSGAAEIGRLASAGADVLVPLPDNRGYSGGVNAGLARARSFRLLATNADVLFRTGSIRPLLDAVDDRRVGAAAPLAFWDAGDRLRLPPGWAPGFRSDLAQLSSHGSGRHEENHFASCATRVLELWERGGDAAHLTGAVLAARRETFDRVGRFDERFPFEYEETEWEDRVRARGLSLRFVPEARVRHRWGSSAAPAGDRSARRARSRDRYRRQRYGALGRALLRRAEKRNRTVAFPRIAEPRLAAREGAWVALSINPSLLPFAGAPLDSEFRLPDDVASRLPRVAIYLRSFRASDGKPLETFVWEPNGP